MKINNKLMALRRSLNSYYWRRFKEANLLDLRKKRFSLIRITRFFKMAAGVLNG